MSVRPTGGMAPSGGGGGNLGMSEGELLEYERVGRRLQLIMEHAPTLVEADQQTALELAQARNSDDDLFATVVDAEGFGATQQRRAALEAAPPEVQRAAFNQMPAAQRRALTGAGYIVPPEGGGDTGFGINLMDRLPLVGRIPVVGNIINAGFDQAFPDRISLDDDNPVLGSIDTVLGGIQHGAGEILEEGVLHPIEAVGRFPSHLYRFGAGVAEAELSASSIGELWSRTGDGEEYLPAETRQRVLDELDGDEHLLDLAIHLSANGGGRTLEAVAEDMGVEPGTPAFDRKVLELYEAQGDERVQEAMDLVERNRVSFGRDLARTVGLDPTSGFGSFLSGFGDGVWTIGTDPTNLLGGAGIGSKIPGLARSRYLRYGFTGADDVRFGQQMHAAYRLLLDPELLSRTSRLSREGRELHHADRVLAVAERIAAAYGADDPGLGGIQLARDLPRLQPQLHRMNQYHALAQVTPGLPDLSTVRGVLRFYNHEHGQMALAAQLGGTHVTRVAGQNLRMLPYLTRMGEGRIRATRAIDRFETWSIATAKRTAQHDVADLVRAARIRNTVRLNPGRVAEDLEAEIAGRVGDDVALWQTGLDEAIDALAQKPTEDGLNTVDEVTQRLADRFTDGDLRPIAQLLAGGDRAKATDVVLAGLDAARWTARKVATAPGSFLFGLTRHAPYEDALLIDGSAASLAEFDRFGNVMEALGVPRVEVDVLRDRFFGWETQADNVRRYVGSNGALRTAVVQRAIHLLFDRLEVPDELRQAFYERQRHAYSAAAGRDEVVTPLGDVTKGALFLDSQASGMIALPSVKELLQVTSDSTVTRWFLHNGAASWLNAKYGRIWKPAVLLRLGFIIRAAGEETLAFAMHHGPAAWAEAKLGTWWVRDELGRDLTIGERTIEGTAIKGARKLSGPLAPMFSLMHFGERAFVNTLLGRPISDVQAANLLDAGIDKAVVDLAKTHRNIGRLTRAERARLRRELPFRQWAALLDPEESFARRWALRTEGFFHDLATRTGLPTKGDIARRVLGINDRTVDAMRIFLTDETVRKAVSEHISAGTYRIEDVMTGLRAGDNALRIAVPGSRRGFRSIDLVPRGSSWKQAARASKQDASDFAEFYLGHLHRIANDDVLGPAVANTLLRYVDEDDAEALSYTLGGSWIDALRNLDTEARSLPALRQALRVWADGDPTEFPANWRRWLGDEFDLDTDLLTPTGLETLDALFGRGLSVRARHLVAADFGPDWRPIFDKDQLAKALRAELGARYADPRAQHLLRNSLQWHDHGLPNPTAIIPDGTTGLHTPAIRGALRPDAEERIIEEVGKLAREYDPFEVARSFLAGTLRPDDPTVGRWDSYRPASRWVTSDPHLAEAVARAIGAERMAIGAAPTQTLLTGGFDGGRIGQAGRNAWELDSPWFSTWDAPPDSVRMVRVRFGDEGGGDWMELGEMRRAIEAFEAGPPPGHVRLHRAEVVVRNTDGTPAENPAARTYDMHRAETTGGWRSDDPSQAAGYWDERLENALAHYGDDPTAENLTNSLVFVDVPEDVARRFWTHNQGPDIVGQSGKTVLHEYYASPAALADTGAQVHRLPGFSKLRDMRIPLRRHLGFDDADQPLPLPDRAAEAARAQEHMDWIVNPEAKHILEERVVGGSVTTDAIDALAGKQVDEIFDTLTTFGRDDLPDSVFTELVDPMARGNHAITEVDELGDTVRRIELGLTEDHLWQAPWEHLPTHAIGPEKVGADDMKWERFVREWFDGPVGDAMSAMIRTPIFAQAFARALEHHRPIMRHLLDDDLQAKVAGIVGRFGRVEDTEGIVDRMALAWDEVFAKGVGAEFDGERSLALAAVEDAVGRGDVAGIASNLRRRFGGVEPVPDPELVAASGGEQAVQQATRWAKESGLQDTDMFDLTQAEIDVLRRGLAQRRHALELVRQNAIEAAVGEVTPFIDDHRVRSVFQEYVGNFVPFWFAEEAFLKRWARAIYERPEVLRRMQLMMHGLRASGVVRKDAEGNEYFVYPLVGEGMAVIQPFVKHVFGQDAAMMLPTQLTGDIRYVLPGFGDQMGVPSMGPLVGLTLELGTRAFPELSGLEQQVVGERGVDRSLWHYFFPSHLVNSVEAMTTGNDAQVHSATIQAMQVLAAAGHLPPEDAGPAAIQEFLDRVHDTARVTLGMRAVLGFALPASGQVHIDTEHLSEEFTSLLDHAPFEEAVRLFVERHPDADPFTVFGTESVGGSMALTTDAAEWLEENQRFVDAFPAAAPWLLPQAEQGDTFDRRAYAQQLANGMRRRKTPEEFLNDLYFAAASDEYFEQQDRFEALADAAAGDAELRRVVQTEQQRFTEAYLNSHPVFADLLRNPARQQRRLDALEQMRQVVAGGEVELPPGMAELIDTFDEWERTNLGLGGSRAQAVLDRKEHLRAEFMGWAWQHVRRNPALRGFFDRVIRPSADPEREHGDMTAATAS